MHPTDIVLLQSDPQVARMLTASLSNSFHGVHVATSIDELRHTIANCHPHAIILDLESATIDDVETLKREFAGTKIICNHRVPDEEMWAKTLSAGAEDCCPSSDTRGILSAAMIRQADHSRDLAA